MRDAQLTAAAVIPLGATKDTAVTCSTDDNATMDFGTPSSLGRSSLHHTGLQDGPLLAVFENAAVMASGDQFLGLLYDSDDDSTYLEIARTATSAATAAAYTRLTCPVPAKHKRYLRFYAMGKSSGTLTTKDINCWLEPGANII